MARFYSVIARRNVVSTRQSREKIVKNAMKFIFFRLPQPLRGFAMTILLLIFEPYNNTRKRE
ncbi:MULTISPECIES: hypothetical protein [unclassified Rickettsia]|uniref:hypothetical protein n=1 Tax=unclassified Rickettsia TaxID=114295 RepID=UPI00313348EC